MFFSETFFYHSITVWRMTVFFCVGVGLVKLRGCKELKNLAASVSTSHLPVFDHFRVDRLIQRHPLITFSQHEEKVERKSQVQPSRHLHPFALIKIRIYIRIRADIDGIAALRHRGHCELKCLCQLRLCAMPGRTLVAHAGTPRDTEGHRGTPKSTGSTDHVPNKTGNEDFILGSDSVPSVNSWEQILNQKVIDTQKSGSLDLLRYPAELKMYSHLT